RPSDRGLCAWAVDRLSQLSSRLPREQVLRTDSRELDEEWVSAQERPTWRSLVSHLRLIEQADLAFPIILSASGAMMDGRHRIAKAVWQGRDRIDAVQFDEDPPPDHVGLGPDDLAY